MFSHITRLLIPAVAFMVCLAAVSTAAAKDMKGSRPAKDFEKFLQKRVAQGNKSDAGIDNLDFNPKTGEITGKVWVLCRHQIGTTKTVKFQGIKSKVVNTPVYAYSYKLTSKFRYNLAKQRGDAELDFGRGIKVRMSEVARILAAIA